MKFQSKRMKSVAACVLAAASFLSAHAADVGGVKVDDTATVGGKTLKLNGAGTRIVGGGTKLFIVGMYLTEKVTTPAEMQSIAGPKRIYLNFQRNFKEEEMGQMFIVAMNKNSTKEEKSKIVNQITQFGDLVSSIGAPQVNDVMTMDWVPGKATTVSFKGKKLGDVEDLAFFSALQRIWIGEQVADPVLKVQILGGK